ncbi:amino acid adenylation domain-containing protein [Paenibacillus sp. P96]|uniref:Amino acid adenylation domain-containing protein n=1 Tax=Paenibacillus zeirhizosphaerae TaxID=2987519 RepID=A0ABT9FVU5_9BACL|nr:non-ribosomal peptide synthetase [Paenibacillus sp. P96]MDP4098854.1 amino acid adenylation domain-containing protein [Paenibacillus sp. P96]
MSNQLYSEKALLAASLRDQKETLIQFVSEELPKPIVPYDRFPQPSLAPVKSQLSGHAVTAQLPESSAKELIRISNGSNANLHALAVAAASVLVYKYCGADYFLLGIPAAFIPVNVKSADTFKELLLQIRRSLSQSQEYARYPLEVLADELGMSWESTDNPFFEIAVMLETVHGLTWMNDIGAAFSFSLSVHDESVQIKLYYDPGRYTEFSAWQVMDQYMVLLGNVLTQPDQPIAGISMTAADSLSMLAHEMSVDLAMPGPPLLHEMFASKACDVPDHTALVCGNEKLTYGELKNQVYCIATVLQKAGVERGTIVAIRVERSFDMVAGILAILSAGGTYLPVEPGLPEERFRYMIEDSGAAFLVTARNLEAPEGLGIGVTIYLDEMTWHLTGELAPRGEAYSGNGVLSEDPAYIIYTSGTSGNPKGTVIRHGQITSLLQHTLTLFSLSSKDRWTLFHSFSFDFSVWEMFGALVTGASLIIVPDSIVKDTRRFARLLAEENVTVLNQTPSAFYRLIHEEEALRTWSPRYVIFGGEALTPGKIAAWAECHPASELINMYGITETTIHATYKKLLSEDLRSSSSNIGRLLPHLRGMVVDRDLHPVPCGVPGELWITGQGVAMGYLGKPELTNARFVRHPLMGETRFYRSGDLVRQLTNGELEYLGRMDQQVKIRGYRIELGEIVEQLLQHKHIADAVVMTQKDDMGNSELAAYLVCRGTVVDEEIREHLGARLPAYMIPSHFYETEFMPLTLNGKLDHKKLLSVRRRLQSNTAYLLPRNDVEQAVYDIWKKYVPQDVNFGIHDSLFHIGGHSLTASLIVNELNRDFGCSLTIRTLFEHSTVETLCREMRQEVDHAYTLIPAIGERENYVCSSAQERIYFHQAAAEHSTLYNMPVKLEIHGLLNEAQLVEALQALVARHRVLRTYLYIVQGYPFMRTAPDLSLEQYWEAVPMDEAALEDYLLHFVQPFDLLAAPLFRVKLLRLSETRCMLLFDLHHLIADGATLDILLRDLLHLYEGKSLEPLMVEYKDYADWQKKELKTRDMAVHEAYWLEQFRDEIPLLALPADFPKKSHPDVQGDVLVSSCDPDILELLKELARQHHTTLFTVMLAAFYVLLHKYTGQEDIVVGTPAEGRERAELKHLAGVFVNSLALRSQPAANKTFMQFLKEVKHTVVSALEHQAYPFEQLVAKVGASRELNHNPLFDTWFSMQTSSELEQCGALRIKAAALSPGISKFDLSLYAVINHDHRLELLWEYKTGLFRTETIQQMSRHFTILLRELVLQASRPLQDISLLSEEQYYQITREWNPARSHYPVEAGIHVMFEQMAAAVGNHVALETPQLSLTYNELNSMANTLANRLRSKGVGRNALVGIMLGRSHRLIVAIMAVLKAGGAYLPIDPSFPEERIRHMLQSSRVKLVLADNLDRLNGWEESCAGEVLLLHDESSAQNGQCANLDPVNEPGDMAYVLYTSGSTGSPKGVVITHDNLFNFIHAMSEQTAWPAGSGVLALTTVSFDIFFVEMLLPLLKGMKVMMADEAMQQDLELLARLVGDKSVHTLQLTPSRLSMMLNHRHGTELLRQAQQILVGGEYFPLKLLAGLQKCTQAKIYNMYGPTETTIWSTVQELTTSSRNDIGRPLANTWLYVLDSQGQPVPPGIPGELYIGGEGVASGYYGNKQLTTERFIPDPFKGEGTMYRTGDWVRWLDDGCLMYMGRLDHQVKIRGYRIDTEEVQESMMSCEGVAQALVVTESARENGDILAGYYTAVGPCSPRQVRAHLMDLLPAYMIPGRLVHIASFPLTPNGKLDRKKLQTAEVIQDQEDERQGTDAASEWERQIAAIWSEVLELTGPVSTTDSFFELGGNSLQASTILLMIHERMGAEVALRQFFKQPTVRALSALAKSSSKSKVMAIPLAAAAESYPLSSAQRRMYFLYELEGEGISYNMPLMVKIRGRLDHNRLSLALDEMTRRHESLRTRFETVNGRPVQHIEPFAQIPVSYRQAFTDIERHDVISQFIQPFSLDKAPLARICIVSAQEEECIFMLDMHHIIADGISTDIFVRDFLALYQGTKLAQPAKVEYKDYSLWQSNLVHTDLYRTQEKFWLDTLGGELPILNLPIDRPRPPVKGYDGGTVKISLMPDLHHKLNRTAANKGVTINTLLLTAYYTLLFRITGQEDIIVGSPFANRQQADIRGVIGMFVNTVALRSRPAADKTVRQYMNEVADLLLLAQEHQELPFEHLIEKLNLPRDMSRNPLFDTMFSYQSKPLSLPQWPELRVEPYMVPFPVSKFDLSLNIVETSEEMLLELEYSAELFMAETVHRYMDYYIHILLAFTERSDQLLGDIEFLPAEERTRLLTGFHRQLAEPSPNEDFYTLFERAAHRYAQQTALVYEGRYLTYAELQRRVFVLACVLQSRGAGPGGKVGVLLERSMEGVVAILAVLRTGAAYVPIDPAYPEERVAHMLNDSGAEWLICHADTRQSVSSSVCCIPIEHVDWSQEPEQTSRPIVNSEDLMYIIYTSGSTGRPKGVMIGHRQFIAMCRIWREEYQLTRPEFSLLQLASIAFDVFTGDLGRTLLHGGKLVISSEEEKYDFRRLYSLMAGNRITLFESTSALIVPFMSYVSERNLDVSFLKLLIIGSDVCRVEDFNRLQARFGGAMRIVNSYGVTEATVDSSYYECRPGWSLPETKVPIGRPLPNVRFYILDKCAKLVPIGVTGELYIGGIGVGNGYHNNPELTDNRFLADPFVEGGRVYRTGDYARWLPDGTVEFLGRGDTQIKIRGLRIETGEIESALRRHPLISEAVVIARQDEGKELSLCAYYTAENNMDSQELRNTLTASLPEFMIPSHWMRLEQMPVSSNGKIDVKSFPVPVTGPTSHSDGGDRPETDIEIKLAEIWKHVLSCDQVGLDDNFFDLGGNSMSILEVNTRIREELSLEFSVATLFRYPTIRSFIVQLRAGDKEKEPAIVSQAAHQQQAAQIQDGNQRKRDMLNRRRKR